MKRNLWIRMLHVVILLGILFFILIPLYWAVLRPYRSKPAAEFHLAANPAVHI